MRPKQEKQEKQKKEKSKRVYEKPKLRTIELAAEEVLATGCKLSTGGFAFGSVPCIAGTCAGGGT